MKLPQTKHKPLPVYKTRPRPLPVSKNKIKFEESSFNNPFKRSNILDQVQDLRKLKSPKRKKSRPLPTSKRSPKKSPKKSPKIELKDNFYNPLKKTKILDQVHNLRKLEPVTSISKLQKQVGSTGNWNMFLDTVVPNQGTLKNVTKETRKSIKKKKRKNKYNPLKNVTRKTRELIKKKEKKSKSHPFFIDVINRNYNVTSPKSSVLVEMSTFVNKEPFIMEPKKVVYKFSIHSGNIQGTKTMDTVNYDYENLFSGYTKDGMLVNVPSEIEDFGLKDLKGKQVTFYWSTDIEENELKFIFEDGEEANNFYAHLWYDLYPEDEDYEEPEEYYVFGSKKNKKMKRRK